MEKVEDGWGFEELKILRELAIEAVDAEDRVVEVLLHTVQMTICVTIT